MNKIKFNCHYCNIECEKPKKGQYHNIQSGQKLFCSRECSNQNKTKKKELQCKICNKTIFRTQSEIKKSKHQTFFCSRSCSATYHNTMSREPIRRSKLEQYIENELFKRYVNLHILYNDRETIKSELDVYIPLLNLAFELNGPFHYEPIFGYDKLNQIQNNDERKFQACLEQGIELCVIDTTNQKRFTEKSSKKFLDIITNIIDKKRRVQGLNL